MSMPSYPKGYFEEGYSLNDRFMTKDRLEKFRDGVDREAYDTPLTETEQAAYNDWVANMKSTGKLSEGDEKYDYDMQGFWKNEVVKNTAQAGGNKDTHFVDTYKKPNHRTFSEESKYYNKDNAKYAGNWDKWNKSHNQPTYSEVKEQKSLLTGGLQ